MRFVVLISKFICILSFGISSYGLAAAEDVRYSISAVYNERVIRQRYDSWATFDFYINRIHPQSLRKVVTISCESFSESRPFSWFMRTSPDLIDHGVNFGFLLSNTRISVREFKYDSECIQELRKFHEQVLDKKAILEFSSYSDYFTIKEQFEKLPEDQINFVRTMMNSSKTTDDERGNFGLYHGYRTPFVFVFLPGLGMDAYQFENGARKLFSLGNNVFSYSFPCQRSGCDPDPVDWEKQMSELIQNHLSKYGDKVVIVGHSLGGNLAIQLAQRKLADALLLFSPAIKLTSLVPKLFQLGQKIKEVNSSLIQFSPYFLPAAEATIRYISQTVDVSQMSLQIPTLLYASRFDPIVSYDEERKFAEKNSKYVKFISKSPSHLRDFHMYNPLDDEMDFLDIAYFLKN